MEEKIQERADKATNAIMSYFFGDKFNDCDDITEDYEMNHAWEFINELMCGSLWEAYEQGGCDQSES